MIDTTDLDPGPILGRSPALVEALRFAERFGPTDLPILLVGETGTGKELFAQLIHRLSGRPRPLVDVNCAGLPGDIADSLLFGHRRGAFTGATDHVTGLLEDADQATLFLDELGSLPQAAQAKLLRVLESHELRRVGETRKVAVRFRTVAAVQPDFNAQIQAGLLRLDLVQRVAGAVIRLAPLRERGNDVVLLASARAASLGRSLDPRAAEVLLRYRWPGNIRELGCAIERAAALARDLTIPATVVAEAIELGMGSAPSAEAGLPRELPRSRRDIEEICSANNWESRRIAAALGVRKTKLFAILGRHGISLKPGRLEGVVQRPFPSGEMRT